MSDDIVLYGYNASSYVFSVRTLLAAKGLDYKGVPVDVLAGEPRSAAHRSLHPFGKVPVLDHGGIRIVETAAIMRYVNDAFPGASFTPDSPVDRARMDMAMSLHDAYGYGAMATVVGYHHFPDFIGRPGRDELDNAVARMHTVLAELMRIRGASPFIAGERPTLADYLVAPACFYLERVEEAPRVFDVPGFAEWWRAIRRLPAYRASEPDLSEWGESQGATHR